MPATKSRNYALARHTHNLGDLGGVAAADLADVAFSGDYSDLSGTPTIPADTSAATVLTEDDETGTFPNSRQLLAGTNVTFDDTTPGERTINASGGGGGGSGVVETIVAGDGIEVDDTDPANPVVSVDADYVVSSAPEVRGASFSGGASAIIVPTNNVPISIREDCTIASVVVLTQGGTGSCVLDIWKKPYASFPGTSGDSICASAKPTISSGIKYTDSTLTGWTTSLSAGDTLLVNLASCSVFKAVSLFLILMPVGSTPADGYTDERVRDIVGGAFVTDTDTVKWTHNDGADSLTANVPAFTTSTAGAVPASGGDATKYLSADGTFKVPPGSGFTESTYTPIATPAVNISTVVAAHAFYYERIGDTVNVFGSFVVDPAGAGYSAFTFPPPVASNFATGFECIGTGVWTNAGGTPMRGVVQVAGNSGSGDVAVVFEPVNGNPVQGVQVNFSYKVIP